MPKRAKRPPPLTRRKKGDKRERTRARLIEAAAVVIGRKGLAGTSLEEIAERAGMTRGAIYGNFRDKEELFLAVAASRWGPVSPPAPVPGETVRERLRRYGVAVADAAADRRHHAVGAASFVQYALAREPLRMQLEAMNAAIYAAAEKRLLAAFGPEQLPAEPSLFVRMIHALTEGVIMLHALAPALMTKAQIVAAFEAIA